jgi:hypothetical protein
MTDGDVVQRVGRLIERAVIALRPRQPHHKPPFVTTIKGTPGAHLMLASRPHLGIARQAQIDLALASWRSKRRRWDHSEALCTVPACEARGSIRGLCERHYDAWRKATRRGGTSGVTPVDRPADPPPGPARESCSTECELSWLAGLLEGEGHFGLTGGCYPVLKLEMCDEDVVTRAARLLGATGVHRDEPSNAKWNPTFVTAVTGYEAAMWMI